MQVRRAHRWQVHERMVRRERGRGTTECERERRGCWIVKGKEG